MIIYLYVKQHAITGMKYFGKTNTRNPFVYVGSGKYWTRHIHKHGKEHVKTISVWGFDDKSICTEFALKFSLEHNIAESRDWANLIHENGIDGFPNGETNPSKLPHNRYRMKHNNPMSVMRVNSGSIKKGQKPVITPERNEKIKQSKIGDRNPNYQNPSASVHLNAIKHTCCVCVITTNLGNLKRWHNANCNKH